MSAILRTFTTTAAREAYRFSANHIGRLVVDQQTAGTYIVIAEGLGSAVTVLLDPAGSFSGSAGGDLSGTYPNPTVAKVQGRSVDSSAPSTDDALVWNGSAWAPTAVAVGSAFVLKQYLADITPASPHTQDDEFDDASISGDWTTWDLGSVAPTFAEGDSGLQITYTGNGAHRWVGKYKAVPDTEFAVIAKVQCSGTTDAAGGSEAALILHSDPTTTTADFRALSLALGLTAGSTSVTSRTWSAYNSASGLSQSTQTPGVCTSIYVRYRVNGTTCDTDYSTDGRAWKQHSTVTLGFTPSHWGPACNVFGSGKVSSAWFRFVRVWSGAGSSDFDASSIGAWKSILYQ